MKTYECLKEMPKTNPKKRLKANLSFSGPTVI